MFDIPPIPDKFYPAMLTISIALILISISIIIYIGPKPLYPIFPDGLLGLLAGILFGAGFATILIVMKNWQKEHREDRNKKKLAFGSIPKA